MLRLGLRLTVSLAAILIMAFLALAPGHKTSASIDLSGPWAIVYSQDVPVSANLGDCSSTFSQDTLDHYIASVPMSCESGGVPTASGGVLNATLTGTAFNGTVTFTPAALVNLTSTASGDGNSITNGTWTYPAGGTSGTWTAAKRITSNGTNQTVTGGGGSSLTFVGTGTSSTAIVTAPTSGGVLPPQFQLVPAAPPQYYHVITVPDPPPPGSGPYTFCVSYPDANNDGIVDGTSVNETNLQIMHLEGGTFVAYPRYSPGTDPVANIVCAQVLSLSEFALVAPVTSATPNPTPNPVGGLVSIVGGGSSSGVSTWLWAATAAVAIALATAGGWVARGRRRLR